MKINILTLFPEMFAGFISNSIIKRAIEKNIVEINIIDFRLYTEDKYGRVDTPPVGGGAGLILKCQPIVDALNKIESNTKKILLSPRGRTFDQTRAKELAKEESITLICGHYEGFDERIRTFVDEEISIGDYVLTGGEIAAMAISDATIRLLKGAISDDSLIEESFNSNLLEYPQYTEPYEFHGLRVPDILYSGNHETIDKYRRKEAIRITKKYRPDIFAKFAPNRVDLKLIEEIDDEVENPDWIKRALSKGKKFIKN